MDGPERRGAARTSAAQTTELAATRSPRPQRSARHEDVAVRRRRGSDHGESRAHAEEHAALVGARRRWSCLRAHDKATGQVLWETELPAGTTGAPMTYMFRGKQHIVVAVGSREHAAEYVALSLP